ncbi:XTP/dITP diphosphatase [Cuniculiplasma sp. SKW3]|uniref:XTP/dITP diphosphatase n=1 Tax=Cuniculiplasma sp. SKW3 TaxID=3400170 RepID=UPI003FD08DC0
MRLRFVTSNEHKYMEINEFLEKHGSSCEWIKMKYEETQEDTTEEVSLASARYLMGKVEQPFFLEDTGLYVRALGGFPGPYSSYVQKTIGNLGILKLVEGKERYAEFKTVISFVEGNKIMQFTGVLEGKIGEVERGKSGFGFDPIFIPIGIDKSLAEMDIKEKNEHSHRINALKLFLNYLNGE